MERAASQCPFTDTSHPNSLDLPGSAWNSPSLASRMSPPPAAVSQAATTATTRAHRQSIGFVGAPSSPSFVSTVNEEEEADDSEKDGAFQSTAQAMRITDLYRWCATVGVLLTLQFASDSFHHRYRHVPHPSEWCVILLLLYALATVCSVRWVASSRPYSGYVLAVGSVLTTCLLTWHWGIHVAQFKDSIVLAPPFAPNTTLHSSTAPTDAFASTSPYPSPSYGFAFGSSVHDVLDVAACFVVLFQNCLQSSFLRRLGVRITAIISVIQWIVFASWPFICPHNSHSTWVFCRIIAMGLWTFHLIWSSYVWESELQQQSRHIDGLRQAMILVRRDLKNGQDADSMLNHLLKNALADALGAIDLFFKQKAAEDEKGHEDGHAFLSKASDILFRGMWWCKLREAMLKVVAGCYDTKQESLDVLSFTNDFVRGRDLTFECPSQLLKLDPVACSLVLDNAATNAIRHGYPNDPQVHLKVEISRATHDLPSHNLMIDRVSRDTNASRATPIKVRFIMTNRANPDRPLEGRWSSRSRGRPIKPNDALRPTLSDGLGLEHISTVANACGMEVRLWQEEQDVFFELSFQTIELAESSAGPNVTSSPRPSSPTPPFPDGLNILALDDSGIARLNLEATLKTEIPNAVIAAYGKDLAEVSEFKRAALEKGDILIMDENLQVPGVELLQGSAILKDLIAAGYHRFACIRSGDSADADKRRSLASGAQWHVGKEVWIREMVRQLRVEYEKFEETGQSKEAAAAEGAPGIVGEQGSA